MYTYTLDTVWHRTFALSTFGYVKMGAESMRILKDLLRLENAKFRVSGERRQPPRKEKRVGLQSIVVPKIDTRPGRRQRRPKPRIEVLENGWSNAFSKGHPRSDPPPKMIPQPTAVSTQETVTQEIPSSKDDGNSTSSSSSRSTSRDNSPQMIRPSISRSPSPSLSSWCGNHEELDGWTVAGRRQRVRWNETVEELGGSHWQIGMCPDSQKAMNHKILEAGWASTFDPEEP
ncbi:hypothetical protein R1sor_019167 [Riccia sorocarpa]|uniref:Uncharacterized protein n=1 Tax=Riccia sorocarpa TaxID=122646 RepID=A0ABD3IBR8_9MARC